MYFFTADEHYWHARIIEYCDRPFANVEEMNETLIANHNATVTSGDVTVHAGDFFLRPKDRRDITAESIIEHLNGQHIFLKGSHDRWLNHSKTPHIWERSFSYPEEIKEDSGYGEIVTLTHTTKKPIILCHYAMAVWSKSHYNSWHLFGHSHGRRTAQGKSLDVGVDNCQFTPISFDRVRTYMQQRPDNENCLAEYKGT